MTEGINICLNCTEKYKEMYDSYYYTSQHLNATTEKDLLDLAQELYDNSTATWNINKCPSCTNLTSSAPYINPEVRAFLQLMQNVTNCLHQIRTDDQTTCNMCSGLYHQLKHQYSPEYMACTDVHQRFLDVCNLWNTHLCYQRHYFDIPTFLVITLSCILTIGFNCGARLFTKKSTVKFIFPSRIRFLLYTANSRVIQRHIRQVAEDMVNSLGPLTTSLQENSELNPSLGMMGDSTGPSTSKYQPRSPPATPGTPATMDLSCDEEEDEPNPNVSTYQDSPSLPILVKE